MYDGSALVATVPVDFQRKLRLPRLAVALAAPRLQPARKRRWGKVQTRSNLSGRVITLHELHVNYTYSHREKFKVSITQ